MRRPIVALTMVVLLLAVVGDAWGQVQYTVTDLGSWTATGINNSGQVVGYGFVSSAGKHALLYSNGVVQDLGTLGGTDSVAYGINSSGQVVGNAQTSGNAGLHPFLYSGGTMQDLGAGPLPYNMGGYASGINNNGQVAESLFIESGAHAFLNNGGVMQDLGTLGGAYSWASGINNSGQVVGQAEVSSGAEHAFLWVQTHFAATGGSSLQAGVGRRKMHC